MLTPRFLAAAPTSALRPSISASLIAKACVALGNLVKHGEGVTARANAARAIGISRGRAAIPDLVEALHSKDDSVMFEALTAIEKIRDPEAAPRIAGHREPRSPRKVLSPPRT